jgi:hypothetical protein
MMQKTQVVTTLLLIVAACAFAGGSQERGGSTEQGATGDGVGESGSPAPGLIDGGIDPVRGFTTDFSRSIVPGSEILSGGPPKDGIPSIDTPSFIAVAEAVWLEPEEPVIVVETRGATKIYPIQILTHHEIVNDVVGDTPLSVTYCPLCDTGIVFRREFDDLLLDFGTTGRLRYSNLIMYDRQTETWWQQATGQAVVGRYAGRRLEMYPAERLPWDVASARYADARVLSRQTGYSRSYGSNPYRGYDTSARPFLYQGPEIDPEYDQMDRVLRVVVDDTSLPVAFPDLRDEPVFQREVSGAPIVVLWSPGTASALDTGVMSNGRDIGSANAYDPRVDGRLLHFESTADGFTDRETGSRWDVSGRAVEGELAGVQLEPLVAIQQFWFTYSAFEHDDVWRSADDRN